MEKDDYLDKRVVKALIEENTGNPHQRRWKIIDRALEARVWKTLNSLGAPT